MLNEAEPDYLSDNDANLTIVLAALGMCIQRVQRFRNAPLKVNPETSDLQKRIADREPAEPPIMAQVHAVKHVAVAAHRRFHDQRIEPGKLLALRELVRIEDQMRIGRDHIEGGQHFECKPYVIRRQRRLEFSGQHRTQLDQHLGAHHNLVITGHVAQPLANERRLFRFAPVETVHPQIGVDENAHASTGFALMQ